MAKVHCPRCQCDVILEQDGRRCSNCGRVLVIPAPKPPTRTPTKPPSRSAATPTKPPSRSAATPTKPPSRSAA